MNVVGNVCKVCYKRFNSDFTPSGMFDNCRFCHNLAHYSNLNQCGMCIACQKRYAKNQEM